MPFFYCTRERETQITFILELDTKEKRRGNERMQKERIYVGSRGMAQSPEQLWAALFYLLVLFDLAKSSALVQE